MASGIPSCTTRDRLFQASHEEHGGVVLCLWACPLSFPCVVDSSSRFDLRQHLASAFTQGTCHLDRFQAEAPSILKDDVPQLLVHASPELAIFRIRYKNDAIGMLDRHENDQIEPPHRALQARQPNPNVEPSGISMCDQIREHVRRAAIEELIFLAVFHALDRALELQLEVVESRRELVPLLFKQV